jgi:hypothetical protein
MCGLFFFWGGGTDLFVALFLPLGDEHGVAVAVFEEPVVELFGDCFFFIVEIVDVARSWELG